MSPRFKPSLHESAAASHHSISSFCEGGSDRGTLLLVAFHKHRIARIRQPPRNRLQPQSLQLGSDIGLRHSIQLSCSKFYTSDAYRNFHNGRSNSSDSAGRHSTALMLYACECQTRACPMNRASLSMPLSLLLLSHSIFGASPIRSTGRRARVSLIQLNHATSLYRPVSDQGFVVVAIDDCSFLLDGKVSRLKSGEHQTIAGGRPLSLSLSGRVPASLVLIKVVSAPQNLTFEETSLAVQQILEDASDRNRTLIIATAPLKLTYVIDQAGEGEPWKSGPKIMIDLKKGGFVWLAPGIHRLRNAGSSTADFVIAEW